MNLFNSGFLSRLITLLFVLTETAANAQSTADTLPPLATIQTRIDQIASDSVKLNQYDDITLKRLDVSRYKDAIVRTEQESARHGRTTICLYKDAIVRTEQALALAQEKNKKRPIALSLNRPGSHNGTLTAESQEGTGAEFVITLPA